MRYVEICYNGQAVDAFEDALAKIVGLSIDAQQWYVPLGGRELGLYRPRDLTTLQKQRVRALAKRHGIRGVKIKSYSGMR